MFQFCYFVKGYRGACVAFDATDAMTTGQVATEVNLKDVEGYEGVLNLNHFSLPFTVYCLLFTVYCLLFTV